MADSVSGLQAQGADLAARSRAALVELYSLDTRLEGARGELQRLQGEIASLDRERASAAHRLAVARRTLRVAERDLGLQLRTLYEANQPDVFSIVLGATSLDEALAGIEGLSRAAGATNQVIAQALGARRQVLRLTRILAAHHAQLAGLQSAAAQREASLAGARAEKSAYLGQLKRQEQLNAEQLNALQAQARLAQAKAQAVTVQAQTGTSVSSFGAQAATSAPPPPPPATSTQPTATTTTTAAPTTPTPTQPAPSSGRTMVVSSTGYSLPGTTATGIPVGPGIVAVDPTVIPLGTRMTIPGYGEGVAADTGSAVKGADIDLWFPTLKQAIDWGRRTVTITLHS